MPVLTFTEFFEPKEAGKSPRAKASDGLSYFLNKEVIDFIKNRIGGPPLEVTTERKESAAGKPYHVVLSAKNVTAPTTSSASISDIVKATAPESAPIQTSTPSFREAVATPAASPPIDVQRLIVRQSCLKSAVEWIVGSQHSSGRARDALELADMFVVWVYETDPQKISATRTAAQSHLEDIREKVADIRAGYSDEDAVCAECGRREFITPYQGSYFCSKRDGGCGAPNKGDVWIHMNYSEWRERTASTSVPWK